MVMITWYEDGRACFCVTDKTEIIEAVAEAVGDFEYREVKSDECIGCGGMYGAGGVADVGVAGRDQPTQVGGETWMQKRA